MRRGTFGTSELSKNSEVRAQRDSSQNSRERGKERRRRGGRREGEMADDDDENDHGGVTPMMFWKNSLHIAQKLLTTTPTIKS
jgi:hypothetical protein